MFVFAASKQLLAPVGYVSKGVTTKAREAAECVSCAVSGRLRTIYTSLLNGSSHVKARVNLVSESKMGCLINKAGCGQECVSVV